MQFNPMSMPTVDFTHFVADPDAKNNVALRGGGGVDFVLKQHDRTRSTVSIITITIVSITTWPLLLPLLLPQRRNSKATCTPRSRGPRCCRTSSSSRLAGTRTSSCCTCTAHGRTRPSASVRGSGSVWHRNRRSISQVAKHLALTTHTANNLRSISSLII